MSQMKIYTRQLAGPALGIFLVLSVAHYRNIASWDTEVSASLTTIIIGLAVLSCAILLRNPKRALPELDLTTLLVVAFFLWCMVTAIFFGNSSIHSVASSFSAIVLIFFFFSFQADIQSGIVTRAAGAILCCYLLFLLLTLDIRWGLTLGGIQPNQFAKLGLALLVLGHCDKGWLRQISLCLAVLCTLIATSRASMVFIVVFLMIYYLPTRPMNRAISLTVGISLATIIIIFDQIVDVGISSVLGEKILLLSDPRLGIGSGFSGRDQYWKIGIMSIPENIMGWGYNTRGATGSLDPSTTNAHQGYLNMILDSGFIGAMLFFSALLSFLKSVSVKSREGSLVARAGLSFGLSYMIIMALDPIYFAISMPLSALFMGFLTSGYGRKVSLSATSS